MTSNSDSDSFSVRHKCSSSSTLRSRRFSSTNVTTTCSNSNTLPLFPTKASHSSPLFEKMKSQETLKRERRYSFLTPEQFRRRRNSTSVGSSPAASSLFSAAFSRSREREASRVSLFDASFQIKEHFREEGAFQDGEEDEDEEDFFGRRHTCFDDRMSSAHQSQMRSAAEKWCEWRRHDDMDDILDCLKRNDVSIGQRARQLLLFCEERSSRMETSCNSLDDNLTKPRAYTNASLCSLNNIHEEALFSKPVELAEASSLSIGKEHRRGSNTPLESRVKKKTSFSPMPNRASAKNDPGYSNDYTADPFAQTDDIRASPKPSRASEQNPSEPLSTRNFTKAPSGASLEKRKSIFSKLTNRTSALLGYPNSLSEPNGEAIVSKKSSMSKSTLDIHQQSSNVEKKKKRKEVKSVNNDANISEDELSHCECFDDATLHILALSLLRSSLDTKEASYWDSLYVTMSLFKLKQFQASLEILEELDSFHHMRSLLESYPSQPVKAKRVLADLVKGCISFFVYILYMSRLHAYWPIYTQNDVVEIASLITDDTIFIALEQVLDECQLSLVRAMRENVEKEIASHAPLLESISESGQDSFPSDKLPTTNLDEETSD